MGIRQLKKCLREAAPQAFIGVPKAQLARVVLGWGRDTIRRVVTIGTRLGWGGWTLDAVRQRGRAAPYPLAQPAESEIAAILFTSGSTGTAKGAVYTHEIFQSQVRL